MSACCQETAADRAEPAPLSSIRPVKPAAATRPSAIERTGAARPLATFRTAGSGPAARTAARTARATSRTSTKSRWAERSPTVRTPPPPLAAAAASSAASRPGSEPAGAPGPTGLKTRSTTASSPLPATARLPASLEAP